MEVLAARCAVRKTSRHHNGVADPGTLRAFMEVLAARCAVRKTSRHHNGVADPGTLRAFMEVLAARCAVRKTSRHHNGVADPGTLRASMEVPAARCIVRKNSQRDYGGYGHVQGRWVGTLAHFHGSSGPALCGSGILPSAAAACLTAHTQVAPERPAFLQSGPVSVNVAVGVHCPRPENRQEHHDETECHSPCFHQCR